jgi:hypothetical protein
VMTSDVGRAVTSEHLAIVRELAERESPLMRGDWLECWFCHTLFSRFTGYFDNPDKHVDDCLWRRAKSLYPGGA